MGSPSQERIGATPPSPADPAGGPAVDRAKAAMGRAIEPPADHATRPVVDAAADPAADRAAGSDGGGATGPVVDAAAGPAADRAADPAVKAAGAWIGQFVRTLKNCRLYYASNPTVVRFRDELAQALTRLLDEHGAVTFRFTSDDILCGDVSLHPARSRDDNLALAFHRDGVRTLTFQPGVTRRELEAVLEAVLLVTGQVQTDDDLVTLLWQADLRHVDVEVVPAEGDVGGASGEESGTLVPWPAAADGTEQAAGTADAAVEGDPTASGTGSRSDDWTTGDLTVEIEAGFEELDALASREIGRFHEEFAAEHEVSLMTTALAIAHAFLDAGAIDEDRAELARFIPRMLRLALGQGSWLEAREALGLLRDCGSEEWSVEAFAQELLQPISVAVAVEHLDRQEPGQVAEFVALARALGEPGLDWINLALAESQQRSTRRVLTEAITGMCRDNPERLAPWLDDPRWYVVRNAVQILGAIGGEPIVGMLRAAMRNPDPRVRRELVQALGAIEPAAARPLLIEMMTGADSRLFCAILHRLGAGRDTPTARMLLGYLQAPGFEQRPEEERRAIYGALGAVGTDEVLLDLEAELARGNWLSAGADAHRQAIARCVARIGTPRARELLERGAASRRSAVRAACGEALRVTGVRD